MSSSWFVLVMFLQFVLVLGSEPHCDNDDCSILKSEGHVKAFGKHRPADGSVPTLKYSPSGSDFYHRYIHGRTPVVIRGGAKHWPAMKHWKNESYLLERFSAVPFNVEFRKHFKNEYSLRKPITLKEFLEIYKTEQVYLDSAFPPTKMMHDIRLPSVLNCEEISSKISMINFLMSSGNTTSAFHHDGYENIITVLSGSKRVIIIDSIYGEKLYADEHKLFPGVLGFEPDRIDFASFPKVAEVPYYEVTLHEGDMMYIPQYWWHIVHSDGTPNIAVNMWFGQFDFEDEFNKAGLSEDADVTKVTELFNALVKKQPDHIKCVNSNKPLNTILKVNVSDPSSGHLRIPRKSERPADVVLASGYTMPVMGFGTATLGNETVAAVKTALDTGYRLIDTAQGYPMSEPLVAEAIAQSGVPRSEIFIITKLHPRFQGYEPTIQAIEMSLKNLNTDYIDLFLIHSKVCDDFLLICQEGEPNGTWQDSWKAMEEMHRKGKIHSLGVSNFNKDDMKELVQLAAVPVSALQNWFDPFHQDRKIRAFCKEHNIRYIGFSTLGTQWVYFRGLKSNPILQSKVLAELSSHYEYVIAQIVLRWAIHLNVTVIPRSRNSRNIYLNFRALDLSLTDNEIELITDLTDYEYHPLERLDRGEGECRDQHEQCEEWAKAGDCKENPDWMLINCRNSCKLCVIDDTRAYEPLVYVGSEDQHIYAIGVLYGELRWKFLTKGKILATPALSLDGETLYFGSNDGLVYSVSGSTGKLLWSYQTDGGVVARPVVTASGDLFIGSHDSHVYSFDAVNGSVNWKEDIQGPIYGAVAVDETKGVLFVGSAAEKGPRVFALSSDTGEIIWEFGAAGKIFGNPALSSDGKVVYFCSLDHNIYALETETGKQLWTLDTGSEMESSPVISNVDGTLYTGLIAGKLLAVNTVTGPLAGTIKWSLETGDEVVSSPVITEESKIYVGVGDGRILAVNQTTSDIIWSPTTGGYVSSSVAVGRDNVVYAASTDHHMYALNADDGSIIWKYKTNGSISLSSPVLPHHYKMSEG